MSVASRAYGGRGPKRASNTIRSYMLSYLLFYLSWGVAVIGFRSEMDLSLSSTRDAMMMMIKWFHTLHDSHATQFIIVIIIIIIIIRMMLIITSIIFIIFPMAIAEGRCNTM